MQSTRPLTTKTTGRPCNEGQVIPRGCRARFFPRKKAILTQVPLGRPVVSFGPLPVSHRWQAGITHPESRLTTAARPIPQKRPTLTIRELLGLRATIGFPER
jgi:hypothetical protein